jgi:hypothetical protein
MKTEDIKKISIKSMIEMLHTEEIGKIIDDYQTKKTEKANASFNVFTLISDLYYRENFHSDIMFEFLNTKGCHGQGDKYLKLFLSMLNINEKYFTNPIVTKEHHTDSNRRIDILIADEQSRKAVIIENKINGAVDMPRQLPDYYKYIVGEGFEVLSIVYIPLCYNKEPDKSDWTEQEIQIIYKLLQVIPAYSDTESNMCKDWLIPSIEQTNDSPEVKAILQQYISLIKLLNQKMDQKVMKEFYHYYSDAENKNRISKIVDMVADIPQYLVERIATKYKDNKASFDDVCSYPYNSKWHCAFQYFEFNGHKYKFDIECDRLDEYNIIFDDYSDNYPKTEDNYKDVVKQTHALDGFNFSDGYYTQSCTKNIDQLDSFIDKVLRELKSIV